MFRKSLVTWSCAVDMWHIQVTLGLPHMQCRQHICEHLPGKSCLAKCSNPIPSLGVCFLILKKIKREVKLLFLLPKWTNSPSLIKVMWFKITCCYCPLFCALYHILFILLLCMFSYRWLPLLKDVQFTLWQNKSNSFVLEASKSHRKWGKKNP